MSEKPVAERLQVKSGRRLAVIGAGEAIESALGPGVARAQPAEAEVVLLVVGSRAGLTAGISDLLPRLRPEAILWIAYPKLSSRLAGDLSRDVIGAAAPAHGLDTVAQIAIDADWSALRLKRVT